MQEFLGLGYFSEVPSVLIDVQRTGPSTGMPTRTQQSDTLLAAYASHGDTKHPLLFPSTPKECFEMTAQAFDLTEQLQTPVIVMTDLDLGMNDHVTEPLVWNDDHQHERGKVLTAEHLDQIYKAASNGNGSGSVANEEGNGSQTQESANSALEQFKGKWGRYLDIDGDGVPYRTIPGTHSTRGAFVTRGSSRDEYAVYTEDADAYRRFVDRLAQKWETAKELVPEPVFYGLNAEGGVSNIELTDSSFDVRESTSGVIFFGTSADSAVEALDLLQADGISLDAMRPRAFPFGKSFRQFVDAHERIFLIEQNRDAQFRSLMMIELGADPAKLISVLNYDGMPITADNIYEQIKRNLAGAD
jgi:2-oxoglutarate ferredoxin oxidoreductase subunit alpha